MTNSTLIGYARCSTDTQDLAAQVAALGAFGVAADRIYTDHDLSGTTRARPLLNPPLTTMRQPSFEMGRQAMLDLHALLSGRVDHRPARVMDSDLVIRGSYAPF